MKPNPWFVVSGHVDKEKQENSPPATTTFLASAASLASSRKTSLDTFTNDKTASPFTQAYLRTRDHKTNGSSMMDIGAGVASVPTGSVNVGNAARHLNAAGSTLIHWLRIRAIAESVPQKSTIIIGWCDIIMKAKAAKDGQRAIGIIAAATPVPLANPIATIIGAAAGLGIKVGLGEACYLAALEIHWRAFQEQTVAAAAGPRVAKPTNFSRPFGPGNRPGQTSVPVPGKEPAASLIAGPTSRIFAEVFKRRGATPVAGQLRRRRADQGAGGLDGAGRAARLDLRQRRMWFIPHACGGETRRPGPDATWRLHRRILNVAFSRVAASGFGCPVAARLHDASGGIVIMQQNATAAMVLPVSSSRSGIRFRAGAGTGHRWRIGACSST